VFIVFFFNRHLFINSSTLQVWIASFILFAILKMHPSLLKERKGILKSQNIKKSPGIHYLIACFDFWCLLGAHSRNRDYFMESARVWDFHTSWWSIWNRMSERSERVRFLILHQWVWKSRTKRFPCCNLFILYGILRFFLFIQL